MTGWSHVWPKLGRSTRVLVTLFCAAILLLISSSWNTASATSTDNAQLSLAGVVDGNNPAGGSELGIHPDTTVDFSASAAPTQKVKDLVNSLGLDSLLDSLLGTAKFQVRADFSHLPGGKKNTVLSGNASAHFTFAHTGTYDFSYHAEKVTVGLLGKTIVPINLDGNQANKAGVELNASNDYVGKVVVSNNPKNGISLQLPSVHVHPKVAGHDLPSINLPGVSTPNIRTEVPNILNPKGGGQQGSAPTPGSGSSSGSTEPDTNQELPVPTRVMGSIDNGSGYYGGGSGGFYGESANSNAANPIGSSQPFTPSSGSDSSGGGAGKAATRDDSDTKRGTDFASNHAPSAQLPVVLAILAIVALSLVTATYARLFLLRRHNAT